MNVRIVQLTPNTPLIHTSFTYSKLNIDEICGSKFYLLYVHTAHKKNFKYVFSGQHFTVIFRPKILI